MTPPPPAFVDALGHARQRASRALRSPLVIGSPQRRGAGRSAVRAARRLGAHRPAAGFPAHDDRRVRAGMRQAWTRHARPPRPNHCHRAALAAQRAEQMTAWPSRSARAVLRAGSAVGLCGSAMPAPCRSPSRLAPVPGYRVELCASDELPVFICPRQRLGCRSWCDRSRSKRVRVAIPPAAARRITNNAGSPSLRPSSSTRAERDEPAGDAEIT